ncbi:POK6 protein, partial [Cepphus grylle]|nr:POK6 protein [Cepphus grylle]
QNQVFEEFPWRSETPVDGLMVFTDAGKKSRRAAVTWCLAGERYYKLLSGSPQDSLQTLELRAVVWTFQNWQTEPINVVSDSMYVVGTVRHLEHSMLRSMQNSVLHQLLL